MTAIVAENAEIEGNRAKNKEASTARKGENGALGSVTCLALLRTIAALDDPALILFHLFTSSAVVAGAGTGGSVAR
ncbi:hypothetical protein [Pelagerythrobacter aerophilus]|uniref:hypothetical protein n=1 Tax=Pelagerythrobacter aerophilus TaxID=2306995 RepID=UPI001E4BF590|nr:hypothetical protein [Pelagerythrobacter aerophilus]